jgi:MoaA/NifB/PqqE/SkfB family radical SAM enzyme
MLYDTSQKFQIHFEPTWACNSKCPHCHRTNVKKKDLPPRDFIKKGMNHWKFDEFVECFPPEFLQERVKVIVFCGSYGDACTWPPLYKICEYILSNTDKLFIAMETNGSMRDEDFWWKLGSINPKRMNIQFDIDGVTQETHSYYRVGTSLEKVLQNTEAAVASGCNVSAQMIVFKHNQHEVESVRKLCNDMGVQNFTTLYSTRKFDSPYFGHIKEYLPFIYKDKEYRLENCTKPYQINKAKDDINCMAKDKNEVFIDVNGVVFPCCYFGTPAAQGNFRFGEHIPMAQIDELLNIKNNSFDNIIDIYNDIVPKHYWFQPGNTCTWVCNNKKAVSSSTVHVLKLGKSQL